MHTETTTKFRCPNCGGRLFDVAGLDLKTDKPICNCKVIIKCHKCREIIEIIRKIAKVQAPPEK